MTKCDEVKAVINHQLRKEFLLFVGMGVDKAVMVVRRLKITKNSSLVIKIDRVIGTRATAD